MYVCFWLNTNWKKKQTLTIGLEYGKHSLWCAFDELQQHLISSRVALMFRQDLVLMMGGSDRFPSRSQRFLKRADVWAL